MEVADSAMVRIMSLFKYTDKNKKKSLEFFVDVEDISEEKFLELKQWIKENVPSTERFTPEWNPDDDFGGFIINQGLPGSPPAQSIPLQSSMDKIRFRFKHEEHAMAFKLFL